MPWWCYKHEQHSIDEICPRCAAGTHARSPEGVLEIIEEEFAKDREYDAPCCESSLDDLLERIQRRIKEECVQLSGKIKEGTPSQRDRGAHHSKCPCHSSSCR